MNFLFPIARGCKRNLIQTGPEVSEEKSFVNVDRQLTCDLWPTSQNNLDLLNFIGVEI